MSRTSVETFQDNNPDTASDAEIRTTSQQVSADIWTSSEDRQLDLNSLQSTLIRLRERFHLSDNLVIIQNAAARFFRGLIQDHTSKVLTIPTRSRPFKSTERVNRILSIARRNEDFDYDNAIAEGLRDALKDADSVKLLYPISDRPLHPHMMTPTADLRKVVCGLLSDLKIPASSDYTPESETQIKLYKLFTSKESTALTRLVLEDWSIETADRGIEMKQYQTLLDRLARDFLVVPSQGAQSITSIHDGMFDKLNLLTTTVERLGFSGSRAEILRSALISATAKALRSNGEFQLLPSEKWINVLSFLHRGVMNKSFSSRTPSLQDEDTACVLRGLQDISDSLPDTFTDGVDLDSQLLTRDQIDRLLQMVA